MKKHLIIAASLLTLFAASCSNEDIIENENNEVIAGKAITLNATINNGTDTRIAYKDDGTSKLEFTWSTNEKFNLYQGTSSTAAEFTKNEEGNIFTGSAPTEGEGSYYAVYGNDITNAEGKLSVDISSQTGTTAENGITHFMVAETTDLTQTLSFSHKLAVLKLNLEFPEGVSGKIEKVTLMGLHNKATYTLAEGGKYAYAAADMGDITATNGSDGFTITDNKITAYVAVFPENVFEGNATIKVEVGDDTYLYTIQATRELTAGKVVPVNVKMVKLEYVDLGLPSGTKWANMNVGANTPEQYGGRYAWGEMVNKEDCTWNTYMCTSESACGGNNDPLKDYVMPNNKSIAGTEYDVAHVKWGGKWQMPTFEQIKELYDNCSRKWQGNYNGSGKKGILFTSNITGYTSNSIFLPVAGTRYLSSLSGEAYYGYYWSATPGSKYAYKAKLVYFAGTDFVWEGDGDSRCYGNSVRPVSE